MADNNHQNLLVLEMQEQKFNLKETLLKYLSYWPWIIGSVAAFLIIAFLYLRYTTPAYKVTSKILIKDEKSADASTEDMLSDIDIFNTTNNVNTEIQVLKTRYLISKVVNELNLNIRYYTIGNIKSTELYGNWPFKINVFFLKDSIPAQELNLQISSNQSVFTLNSDSLNGKFRFGDSIKYSSLGFTVQQIFPKKGDYKIIIKTADAITDQYYNDISAEIPDKQANVIQLTLDETVPLKGEAVLNKLYEVYNRINQEDKTTIADSTINFINNRLAIVSDELSGVEKNIEQFKRQNSLVSSINEQGTMVLNNANDLQKQITQQQVQINVLESVENHIKNNASRVVPNAADIQDPTYISTVEKYNNLVLERDRQLQTSKPDNPLIKNLNEQIENLRADLIISLDNIRQGMVIAKNELEKRNTELSGDIKTAPNKERIYLDISRQQDIKQQLYLYLLQKREETAISKSGTLANSRLIEPAKSNSLPFFPNNLFVYLIAFGAGLIIPILILYGKDFFNNTITDRKDVTSNSKVPVLGEVGHNATSEAIIIKKDSRTALAEQLRIIRTNLQFVLKGKDKQAILITSSMGNEGKTFFSINLACALAISEKRVVIMEMDLRKPKISNEMKLTIEQGFSDYIAGYLEKKDLIKASNIHPNLFVISSGTLPPNPAELLLDDKVEELFIYLKTQFEYIIVDTPPVSIVTDAVLLNKYVDASIYIVRQNFTTRQQIEIINDLAEHSKLPNLSILINDVKPKKGYGYGYGYAYGYGYTTGYYTDDKEKKRRVEKIKR